MSTKKATKKLSPSDFVHLHNHTQYSLLDGLTKVPALIDYVAQSGMEAVAMTDHGTLSGAIEFYETAKKKKVKPIIGIEAYVAPRKHTDKDPGFDKQYNHLIILAMNNQGYENLMRLSTIAHLEGFYYKPRIDHDLLEKYNEGLIVLSGCMNGEVSDALRSDQYAQALKIAKWYQKIFGDRYYVEIQDHGHPNHSSTWDEQTKVNNLAFKLADELDIKTVITGDAHYLKPEDQEAHEILLCVQTGSFLSDENRMSLKDFDLYVASPEEIIDRWGDEHADSIRNTAEIASRCSLDLSLGNILIPKFSTPKGETEQSLLRSMVYRGLLWRYAGTDRSEVEKLSEDAIIPKLKKEIVDRANYELTVINDMGFNGYFLIIADFINWGKDQGIVFGPGRGSAAGSIIAYALNITELDPLAYDLLFERFLNPDRISMPDIDIDIQDSRRNEVIEYCVDKYGDDRVANIVTFGRMAARNAVRDVARVLQVPYAEADRLAKMIPPPVQGRHIPLETSIKKDADLANEYKTNPQTKEIFDLAVRLEGTIRSHGVHAAGVVIAPDDIVKFTPLEMAQKGVVSTQYSMGPVEEIGLLKMDFLGLSNLTIIKNTLRIAKRVYGDDIDISKIPLDDKKTYSLFQKGDTTGVFQLESAGMKRYLRELKPTVFDDIIAMVALYRPGPMQFIDDFISRKNGEKDITYIHPKMQEALKTTYGVLVYQEQVMQISKDLCGFTGGQADTLRKGIAKKIPSVLAKMKVEFIEGAINHSQADRGLMEKFWKQLEDFAAYCFNKSHAACYGLIAYWTAYLKAHYPAAFMAALMTSAYDDTDRLAVEIAECRAMGLEVLSPDVEESFLEFAVIREKGKKDCIRFGMNAIKNVGSGAVEEIIQARDKSGGFKDLEGFLSAINPRIVNKKTLESLIKSGAMDKLGDRSILLENIEALVAYSSRSHKDKMSGQTDLFGGDSATEATTAKLNLDQAVQVHPQRTQLLWERELLGLYLSSHPLEEYKALLEEQCVSIGEIKQDMDGRKVRIGGSVTEYREIVTKKGQKMAFVSISDMGGEVELILFPGVFQQTIGIWDRDSVVMVDGRINTKDKEGNSSSEIKIMVDGAREITHEQALAYQSTGKKKRTPKPAPIKKVPMSKSSTKAQSAKPAEKRVFVRMQKSDDRQLTELKGAIDKNPGTTQIVLVVGSDNKKQIIRLPNTINPTEEFLANIQGVFGQDQVKYQ